MATIIGTISEFDEAVDTWQAYIERMEQFFVANNIEQEEKKKAIMISSVGAKTYKLMCSLMAPNKPSECQLQSIIDTVRNHHNPRPSTIVQRFKFNSKSRQEGESVRTFVAELKKLSEFCEYGDNLEEMLRDRLVCGINDRRMQQKLLSEKDLTYKKAVEIAQGMEAAMEGASDIGVSNAKEELKFTRSSTNIRWTNALPRGSTSRKTGDVKIECPRCGGPHHKDKCRFKDATCYRCSKKGHIAALCRSSAQNYRRGPRPVKFLGDNQEDGNDEERDDHENYALYSITDKKRAFEVELKVDQRDLYFQVDTGASLSVMTLSTFKDLWPKRKLSTSRAQLKTYTGEKVKIFGSVQVMVCHNGQNTELPLLVVDGQGPNLIGRNWLSRLKLDWSTIFQMDSQGLTGLNQLLEKHKEVFKENSGKIKDLKATIHIDKDSPPIFRKARQVPYALREGVEAELDRLEREGVVEKIDFSEWATPVVPILKSSGQVRLCGDYKVTVNKVAKVDVHPLPTKDEMLMKLQKCTTFTRMDLSNAYHQVELDDESQKLCTINTHRGLYKYNRLPFGVAAAPAIFQRSIESWLKDIEGVCVFIDDVFIGGETEEKHLERLEMVLRRFEEKGVRVRKSKCLFMKDEVTFLGLKLNKEGLQPLEDKITAIKKAPVPQDVHQLRSYLGLVNFYSAFLPNLSTELAPLYRLLQKDVKWAWSNREQDSFSRSKSMLTSDKLLAHFDPSRPLVISCDASPYGVGAVLALRTEDNRERPIAYASRSLNAAERNYAQIDKEGLAVVFAVNKFHKYIYGRKVTIFTDHKPLVGLFGETKSIPPMASSRVQRWALTLSAYSYELLYRPGKENANSDGLSRLPLPSFPREVPIPQDVVDLLGTLDSSPVSSFDIATHTTRDDILCQVLEFVKNGWPNQVSTKFQPYLNRRAELSIDSNCLLWGTRVVVPPALRKSILQELHDEHQGMTRMKALARSRFWWPNLDKDIESMVRDCYPCQASRKMPPAAPLHQWSWPSTPWSRLHIDFAGPFLGHQFLVVVDAHSKWLDVAVMKNITTSETISELRKCFANHGIPDTLVSDNGPTFTSADFTTFLQKNGIQHIRCSPYHPSSNGQAERAVQTLKEGLKRMSEGSISEKVTRFLFKYRITPHATTGLSPAELLMGRKLKSRLDLTHPSVLDTVKQNQIRQKAAHDRHARHRDVKVGDTVLYRNYTFRGPRWLPGTVVDRNGPCFRITAGDGIVRRHQDQLRLNVAEPTAVQLEEEESLQDTTDPVSEGGEVPNSGSKPPTTTSEIEPTMESSPPSDEVVPLRRSTRLRRAPDKYEP